MSWDWEWQKIRLGVWCQSMREGFGTLSGGGGRLREDQCRDLLGESQYDLHSESSLLRPWRTDW